MNPKNETLLSLLTGGRYYQSSDLPTGREVASSAIDKLIESDQKRRSQVIMPAGKGMFGRQTKEFTQGDLEDILAGLLGGGGVAGTVKAGAPSLRNLAKGLMDVRRAKKGVGEKLGRTQAEEIERLITPEQRARIQELAERPFTMGSYGEMQRPLRAATELYGKKLPSGERVVRLVDPERQPPYGLPMGTLRQLVSLILNRYSK